MERTKDTIGFLSVVGLRKVLAYLAHARGEHSKTMKALDDAGIAVYRRHYYEPFISRADLRYPLDQQRALPGIRLDAAAQLDYLRRLRGLEELRVFTDKPPGHRGFYFDNGSYGYGDAEVLHGIVRTARPKTIIEVGAGNSTKIINHALERTREEDGAYQCRHLCIEPFEQPWLEAYQVELMRSKVETLDPSFFDILGKDDILFIDSSHIIRPQGDVLFEYLDVLPRLKPGVIVHVHDIFTPADYPAEWLLGRRLLWNEQYLLEAFLTMNSGYEILVALNWLANTQNEALCGILQAFARKPHAQPGAFWIRRV